MHVVLDQWPFFSFIHSLLEAIRPLLPAEKCPRWIVDWRNRLAADRGAFP
ncbi:hypothetical protein PENARI_c007G10129 [Penicillium arizonense]|uniref:Uncharacterized protein n=1 Tax=Penicillium arizonense TaxID=1835702 RepID=A0A1F5LLC7_PENAI|nr:hypothetical protein PENARI_c007G10129 [Penicillium arizonense]OGE54013.1 hypothetical protein PENARI_c007G10129 [Penicillium arizonense]